MNGNSEFQFGPLPQVPSGRGFVANVFQGKLPKEFRTRAGALLAAVWSGCALGFFTAPSAFAQAEGAFYLSSTTNSVNFGNLTLEINGSSSLVRSSGAPLSVSPFGQSSAPLTVASPVASIARQPVVGFHSTTESLGSFLVGASLMYTAVDLADLVLGQDLWRYDYELSGTGLLAGQGLTVFFNYTNYTLLQNPPPPAAGWDILSVQPDTLLSSAGFFDAQALSGFANLSGVTFSINFIWLGSGTPGGQPFSFYDTNFSTISGGQTSAVPEPSVAWLGFAGLAAWAGFARARLKKC